MAEQFDWRFYSSRLSWHPKERAPVIAGDTGHPTYLVGLGEKCRLRAPTPPPLWRPLRPD